MKNQVFLSLSNSLELSLLTSKSRDDRQQFDNSGGLAKDATINFQTLQTEYNNYVEDEPRSFVDLNIIKNYFNSSLNC